MGSEERRTGRAREFVQKRFDRLRFQAPDIEESRGQLRGIVQGAEAGTPQREAVIDTLVLLQLNLQVRVAYGGNRWMIDVPTGGSEKARKLKERYVMRGKDMALKANEAAGYGEIFERVQELVVHTIPQASEQRRDPSNAAFKGAVEEFKGIVIEEYGEDAIAEAWIEKLWKKPLSKKQRKRLMDGYEDFYLTLTSLVNSYRFNIIFDGHSMKHAKDRAELSFGTKYIPRFYMPVVRSMKERLLKLGYTDVAFDKPFSGGYILQWLSRKFPNIFICAMEVNKKLYMNTNRNLSHEQRIEGLSTDILQIVNIE